VRELYDLYTQRFSPEWSAPNVYVYTALAFGCWAYALARGGGPEKAGATVIAVSILLAWVTPPLTLRTIEFELVAVDILWMIAFLALALKADRFWPLWIAAFQVITLAGHVVRLIEPDIAGRTYVFMVVVWSYPMILLIIVGTWRHQQRLARFGFDRSWSRLRAADRRLAR
jgi:hypothetical protein